MLVIDNELPSLSTELKSYIKSNIFGPYNFKHI